MKTLLDYKFWILICMLFIVGPFFITLIDKIVKPHLLRQICYTFYAGIIFLVMWGTLVIEDRIKSRKKK